MRIAPRHLVLTNALTAVVCVLHALTHALGVHIGEWHDYAVYGFVALSLATSLLYVRHAREGAPLTA